MYTILYRNKYDVFNFTPFVPDSISAKVLFLKYRWWGAKAVRIDDKDADIIIWETPNHVIHSIDNPNPTPELPF